METKDTCTACMRPIGEDERIAIVDEHILCWQCYASKETARALRKRRIAFAQRVMLALTAGAGVDHNEHLL